MVKGLEVFREHFRGYEDRYVLIGGTASSIVMEEFGVDFRATKYLDIVLFVESLDVDFVQIFWKFIENGEYVMRQRSTGKKLFYRFHSPQNKAYPWMLELFSRVPDFMFDISPTATLSPIPVEEDTPSLSAILLDSEYYRFIHENIQILHDLPIVGPEILIPLKARAWLDLTARKSNDGSIDSRSIRKHRNDILRLFPLLSGRKMIPCPVSIQEDLKQFTDRVGIDHTIELKTLGIHTLTLDGIMNQIRKIYGISYVE